MSKNAVINAYRAANLAITENSDFRQSQSATKARAYISAIDTLIPLVPMRTQLGGAAGESVQWSIDALIKMREVAEQYLTANQSGRRISYGNPCGFRD